MNDIPLYLIPSTMCDDRLWASMQQLMPQIRPHHCDYASADTMESMMQAVLDQAPAGPSHLVGFSLGGYLAIMAALKAPDLFKSLTVIAASPYGLTQREKDLRRRNADMLSRIKYRGMSKARLAQFVSADHLENKIITNTITQMEKDLGQEVLLRQLLATVDREDISQALLGLPIPKHFIMADEDQLVPMEPVEKLSGSSKTISVTRITGSGHMIPLEAPGELAQVLIDKLGYRST